MFRFKNYTIICNFFKIIRCKLHLQIHADINYVHKPKQIEDYLSGVWNVKEDEEKACFKEWRELRSKIEKKNQVEKNYALLEAEQTNRWKKKHALNEGGRYKMKWK